MLLFSSLVTLAFVAALSAANGWNDLLLFSIGAMPIVLLLGGFKPLFRRTIPSEHADRRKARAFTLLALSVLAGLNLLGLSKETYVNQILASLMFVVAIYPSWDYLNRNENNIPLLPVFAFVFWVVFGMRVFIPLPLPDLYLRIRPDQVTYALCLATLGLVMFLIFFYRFPFGFWRLFPTLPDTWIEARVNGIAWFLALGGLAVSIGRVLGIVPDSLILKQVISFLGMMSLLGLGILFLLLLRGQLRNWERHTLLLGILPLHVITWWGYDGGGAGTTFVLVLGLIYLGEKRRVPWLLAVIGGLAVFSLIAFRPELRGYNSSPINFEQERNDLIGRFNNFLIVNKEFYKRFSGDELQQRTASVINRFDNLGQMAFVVQQTPGVVPYWGGETYENLKWKFVPRVLYPDKPIDDVASSFPRRYAIAGEDVLARTTIPIPFLAEFYANFGVVGIVVGMALLGLTFQTIYRFFNSPHVHQWSYVCAAVISAPVIIGLGANFSLVFGGLILPGVVLWLLGTLVMREKSSQADLAHVLIKEKLSPVLR